MRKKETWRTRLRVRALLLLAFSLTLFVTALIVNRDSEPLLAQSLEVTGGSAGPLVLEEDSLVRIEVSQFMSQAFVESSVSLDVLGEERQFLFNLEDDFYYETGQDSDGSWTERNESVSHKILLKPGTYYFEVQAEPTDATMVSAVNLMVTRKLGGTLWLVLSGIGFMMFGFFLLVVSGK